MAVDASVARACDANPDPGPHLFALIAPDGGGILLLMRAVPS